MPKLAAYSRESVDMLRSRDCRALGHVPLGTSAHGKGLLCRERRVECMSMDQLAPFRRLEMHGQQKPKVASSCIGSEDVSQVIHGREDTMTLLKGRCKPFGGNIESLLHGRLRLPMVCRAKL
jgi:hypothetical protein